MFIQHKQYLYLLDRTASLQDQVSLLKQQNRLLSQCLHKQRQKNYYLEQANIKRIKELQIAEQIHMKKLKQQNQNNNQILSKINELNVQNKKLVLQKVSELEKNSFTQIINLQKQKMQQKLQRHQQIQFIQRIKKLYIQSHSTQILQKQKSQPSLIQLMKWIKTLPGVQVSGQKVHFINPIKSQCVNTVKSQCDLKKQQIKYVKVVKKKNKKSSSKNKILKTQQLSQTKSRFNQLKNILIYQKENII